MAAGSALASFYAGMTSCCLSTVTLAYLAEVPAGYARQFAVQNSSLLKKAPLFSKLAIGLNCTAIFIMTDMYYGCPLTYISLFGLCSLSFIVMQSSSRCRI